jgi:hypothetical protein
MLERTGGDFWSELCSAFKIRSLLQSGHINTTAKGCCTEKSVAILEMKEAANSGGLFVKLTYARRCLSGNPSIRGQLNSAHGDLPKYVGVSFAIHRCDENLICHLVTGRAGLTTAKAGARPVIHIPEDR